jgi:diguanylate cyclase (GGDEF)-like protein
MALSQKGWAFAKKLFAQKVGALHELRSKRQTAARNKGSASTGAWIPEVYRESMREFGRAWLESFIEALDTEGSLPSQDDLDEIQRDIAGAVKAGIEAGSHEAQRISLATGSTLLGPIQSRLAHDAAGVTTDLHHELGVWVARKELQGARAPARWWLDDPEDGRDQSLPLASKKAYNGDLSRAISEATSTHPLALLLVDVDHFKRVNDEHGHSAGDAALQAVALQLQAAVAGRGKAYRYGGEELVLLLPNFSEAEALATAERVRTTVGMHVIPEIGRAVTLSVGVAIASSPEMSPKDLFDRSDDAVYKAKETRNAVVRWDETLPPKSTR